MIEENRTVDTAKKIIIEPLTETDEHLKRLDALDSLRIHSLLILTATNKIRKKIEAGEWDTKSPEDWFFDMYGYHIGADRSNSKIYHLISRFEPSQSGDNGREQLDLGQHILGVKQSSQEPSVGEPMEGFEGKNLRKNEMRMIRAGTMQNRMIGVPKSILPTLSEHYFSSVSAFLDREKQSPRDSEQYRERAHKISLSLAFLLDFFHFKPDVNGRTTEDFMVQMQRVLLNGDMQHIRTWSQHGLRAKDVAKVLTPEYAELVKERDEAMDDRSDAVLRVLKILLLQLQTFLRAEGMLQADEELTDSALIDHAPTVEKFFTALIDKITREPEEFLQTDFVTLGFEKLWHALEDNTLPDLEGHTYNYQEFDFYQTHTGSQEVFQRLQVLIQEQKIISEEVKEKKQTFTEKLPDWESIERMFEVFFIALQKKVNDLPDVSNNSRADISVALYALIDAMEAHETFQLKNSASLDTCRLTVRSIFDMKVKEEVQEKYRSVLTEMKILFPLFVDYLKGEEVSKVPSDYFKRFFSQISNTGFQELFTQ
jgi:hypothetical protein